MSDEKAVTVRPDVQAEEWRTRDDIAAMGSRIKTMLPGGNKLSDSEAMSLAQYSLAMGANPYRGEVYGFKGKHGFQITEGYKLLVRWARRQCEYTDRYVPAPGIPDDAIGIRCFILREDKKVTMREFISMGASFQEAYEMAATFADGVIGPHEMVSRSSGNPLNPPTGWTWEQVARKRALKNALNLSHGSPSLKEIASSTWDVNGTETKPEDWEPVTPQMSQGEREAVAEFGAVAREAHEHVGDATATQADDELFGDYRSDGDQPINGEIVEEADDAPPQEDPPVPNWVTNPDITQSFYIWLGKQHYPNGDSIRKGDMYKAIGVTSSLKEFTGTVGEAKAAVKELVKNWQPTGDEPPPQ